MSVKGKPAFVFLTISLLTVATFAYSSLSLGASGHAIGTASSSQSNQMTVLIEVVNDSTKPPVSGVTVAAGPASSSTDVAFTPDGPTLNECVHEVPSGSLVQENGSVVLPNGTTITFAPCPLKDYVTNSVGQVVVPDATGTYIFVKTGYFNQWKLFATNNSKSIASSTWSHHCRQDR